MCINLHMFTETAALKTKLIDIYKSLHILKKYIYIIYLWKMLIYMKREISYYIIALG